MIAFASALFAALLIFAAPASSQEATRDVTLAWAAAPCRDVLSDTWGECAPGRIVDYKVLQSTDAGATYSLLFSVPNQPGPELQTTIAAQPGLAYVWKVVVVGSDGEVIESEPSDPFGIDELGDPGKPIVVSVTVSVTVGGGLGE